MYCIVLSPDELELILEGQVDDPSNHIYNILDMPDGVEYIILDEEDGLVYTEDGLVSIPQTLFFSEVNENSFWNTLHDHHCEYFDDYSFEDFKGLPIVICLDYDFTGAPVDEWDDVIDL